MTFVGASPDVEVRGLTKLRPYVNFFLGDDPDRWRSRVPTFDSVLYEGLYPGVDVELHRRQGRIEYDFILAPGVDPSVVRVRFGGASSIELDETGALLCRTAVGTLRQEPPVAFHRGADGAREFVECRIVAVGEREYGFVAPAAAGDRVLVIDPQVGPAPRPDYFTYLGGSDANQTEPDGMDEATDVVVSGGKAIVTGATASIDFPITPGVTDGVGPSATDTDVFVTQLDHDGTGLLWSTYIGGTTPNPASFNDDEIGMGVARAVSGAVCITGFTTDDDFPQVNAIQTTSNFGEAFVARISGGGTTLDFSTYLGGDFWDVGTGIATDVDENVYVCGYTDSWTGCLPSCRAFPTMGSVIEPAHTGSAEAGFLSKFDSTGAMLLSTFVRAASAESGISARCWALALDPDEIDPTRVDVWLTGDLKDAGPGDDFHLTPNAFQPSFAGGALSTDGFVVGLNDTFSSVLYGSYLGGELDDVGLGIDVYPDSKIAVVGQTRSTAFPIANAHQPVHGGQADGFYMRLDPSQSLPSATLVCSSYFGGAQDDHLTDVVSDATGRDLYLTGSSEWPGSVTGWPGPTIPATVSGLDVNHGGTDTVLAVVTGFDLTFLVFMGGIEDDVSNAIDLDFGSVTLCGSTVFDPGTPAVHFYAVLDNVDGMPGNNEPPGFQTTPLGGEPYTPTGAVGAILEWPGLVQPAEMDAFVLRFDTP